MRLPINYLRQVTLFTAANMRARYRGTLAGFLWVVLNPMILFAAQSLVFKHILKIDIPHYGLFLLGGLLPWLFITQSFDMCIPILHGASNLLRSYKIDPTILVAAQLLDNFLNFFFAFVFILIPTLLISGVFSFGVLLIPLALLNLIVGVGAAVWLLSVCQVFYRDTKFVMQFLTSVLFFLTPIFYPLQLIPESYRWLVQLNPFYRFIEPFRLCLYQFRLDHFISSFSLSVLYTVSIVTISYILWRVKKNDFYLSI